MASQQAFQQYGHTNKGTLQPGQTISVNKYNVQVERYLSQGGFAHVYLVRTAVPVYNTTHHVLKRIAVANDAMLTEVKKEVDIMRILKGHPNIVHLIDAAWHRMPNGMYEVFILMEFCAGGGIIDMMNRRLRERLTEAEILQIFVDVCEGVAAMHNLRPALLHRDLKVENILQSTPTSFKLCDFGSATPVSPKPPSTTQEIRALEADLNRHTTLQYRAPEMVDPYLRRPVDEKSDVWALGVLLYKLCYYTTPFEEHGPLAILNVQYRTPPYPVYSTQMNQLIANMLREHGAQRPSIFEILLHVHRLRGTKSRFSYTIPTSQPLSPRLANSPAQAPTNPLNDLVSFRPPAQGSNTVARNAGVQAREKVLEAIAPMRRGRPTSSSTPDSRSRQASPQKDKNQNRVQTWLDEGFTTEEDKVRKAAKSSQGPALIKGHRSGVATTEAWKPRKPASDEAWNIEGRNNDAGKDVTSVTPNGGFENDFAEKLWDSFEGSSKEPSATSSKPLPIPGRPPLVGAQTSSSNKLGVPRRGQDAFEGLGLSPSDRPPPQTLGEKTRTGLSVTNGTIGNNGSSPSSNQISRPSSSLAPRPTPSPRPSLPSPAPQSSSSTWKPSPTIPSSKPSPSLQAGDMAAEARFPSLEELDATFSPSPPIGSGPPVHSSSQPQLSSEKQTDLAVPPLPRRPRMSSNATGGLRPIGQQTYSKDGVRSQQVTGVAMRESKGTKVEGVSRRAAEEPLVDASVNSQPKRASRPIRPSLSRKHRSSISIKHPHPSEGDVLGSPSLTSPHSSRFRESKDWLTGDDDGLSAHAPKPSPASTDAPVLREFTNKRASYVESSPAGVLSPQEAVSAEQLPSLSTPAPSKPKYTGSQPLPLLYPSGQQKGIPDRPVENRSPVRANITQPSDRISSSSDEGPEDVNGFSPPKEVKKKESRRHKGRQSSVTDLVGLWGGGVVHLKEKEPVKEKEREIIRSPATGDYKSYGSDAYVKPPARRSSFLPSSSSNLRSASPQPMPNSPPAGLPRSSRPQRSPSHHRKQSSAAPPANVSPAQTPAANRGRPQSMFIFPVGNSKSDSSAALTPSPGLSPPEEPTPRRVRRTSISDMVQRYESIGGPKIAGPTSPPIAPQKPTALKVGTQNTSSSTNTRAPKMSLSNSPTTSRGSGRSASSLPVADDASAGSGPPSRQRVPPGGLPRTSPADHRESIWTREVEKFTPGLPRQPSPPKVQKVPEEATALDRQTSQFTFPTRQPTPPTEESQAPPSPDRPYQGVGKLIDQWQRKTADTEPVRSGSPRRSGFGSKRALPGLVGGGAGRGR